jgi:hypothetical protein
MDRIIGANTIDLGGGRRGFRGKDTVGGVPGTELAALWHNAIQEEVVGAVEGAGFVPSNADFAQLRRVIRSGAFNWKIVGGTANALTVDLTPDLAAYAAGLPLLLLTGAGANTDAMTINVDGVGVVPLVRRSGSAMAPGDVPANSLLDIAFDGAAFRCRGVVASDLRAAFNPVNLSVVNFDVSGSWTVPAGVLFAFIEAWGAGGGGGAGDGSSLGGLGGGGGLYAARYVAVTPGAIHAVTIGVGGNTSTAPGNSGGSGGSTSVGALLTASGGGAGGPAGGSPGAGGTSSAGAQIIVPGGGAFVSFGGNGSPGGNGARGAQGGQQGNSGQQPGGGAAGNTNVNSYGGQKGGNGRVTITYATP